MGVFPWLLAAAAACLAVCCVGLVAVHGPGQSKVVLIGGGWAVLAFLALACSFVAIGFGDVLGVADSVTGPLAAVPVVLAGFGYLSLAPALLLLGYGSNRDGRLPWWGVWTLWFVALIVPATLVIAGWASGDMENIVPGLMLSIFGVGWVVVGLAISTTAPAHSGT